MAFNRHRTEQVPEWELVEPEERRFFQRVAAKTNGFVTPANGVTLFGVGLFMDGLYDFTQGSKVGGLAKMIGGGFCDLGDGIVAEFFETKSPKGEAFDAAADKVKIGAALVVFGSTEVVPLIPVIFVAGQNLANVAFTGIAKAKGNEIHPGTANKVTAATQAVGLGAYVIADIVQPGAGQTAAEVVGFAGTVVASVTVGGAATHNLYNDAFHPQLEQELEPSNGWFPQAENGSF